MDNTVHPCSSFLSGCGWNDWRDDFKTDCFHYTEDHDMGATIPWCGHTHMVIERKKCNDCKHYISKADVYEVASQIIGTRGLTMEMISWNYCKDPNEINSAIMSRDENWYGITAENIISITWDWNHGCYIVFWRANNG